MRLRCSHWIAIFAEKSCIEIETIVEAKIFFVFFLKSVARDA